MRLFHLQKQTQRAKKKKEKSREFEKEIKVHASKVPKVAPGSKAGGVKHRGGR